uniref:Uncharacterized protein n=1 Tax=Caenorhabditis japonica TaxID=281687 RepID=A0A8R1E7L1_CAEJA
MNNGNKQNTEKVLNLVFVVVSTPRVVETSGDLEDVDGLVDSLEDDVGSELILVKREEVGTVGDVKIEEEEEEEAEEEGGEGEAGVPGETSSKKK